MMISKSSRSWKESCSCLFQSLVGILTFDYVAFYAGQGFHWVDRCDLPFLKNVRCWWWWVTFIPEELVEVLTLGYFTLRQ